MFADPDFSLRLSTVWHMRGLLLAVFFTGVVLVITNQLVKANAQPPRIEYRYLPRDLDTYLREQPLASVQFQGMFRDEELSLIPRGSDSQTIERSATKPVFAAR